MIEVLRSIVRLAARDDLTVQDVVDAIGPILRDPGLPMPLELRPEAKEIRAASLARYPDVDTPYSITLEPVPNSRPIVAELVQALGPFERLRTDRGMPLALLFRPKAGPSSWSLALIAEVPGPAEEIDAKSAVRVTVRRDRTGRG